MTIGDSVQSLRQTLAAAMQKYHRAPGSVHLLAISKGQPVSAIEEAFAAGIADFGENYWQEAQTKIQALKHRPLTWHFTGPVQSNKTLAIATEMDWVHTIDREKIAKLLSLHRPARLKPLNLCIQVNLDKEASKSGLSPEEVLPLARLILQLPRLRLRGLMAIPLQLANEEHQFQSLPRLTILLQKLDSD